MQLKKYMQPRIGAAMSGKEHADEECEMATCVMVTHGHALKAVSIAARSGPRQDSQRQEVRMKRECERECVLAQCLRFEESNNCVLINSILIMFKKQFKKQGAW